MIKQIAPADAINTALAPILTALNTAFPAESVLYGRLPVEGITLDGADGEKPKRLPLFYLSATEYERVVPDENNGLMAFFVAAGRNRYAPDDADISDRYVVSQPVALIVWGRRTVNVEPVALLRSILWALAPHAELVITSTTDELQAEVFRGLDYDFDNHRFLMHPFFGLRIEGTLTYFENQC